MLDNKSYKVLKYLCKSKKIESISSLKSKFNNFDINGIHNYLVELDLIKNNNGTIKVTYKGKIYRELYYRNSFLQLFWALISVLVGFLLGRI